MKSSVTKIREDYINLPLKEANSARNPELKFKTELYEEAKVCSQSVVHFLMKIHEQLEHSLARNHKISFAVQSLNLWVQVKTPTMLESIKDIAVLLYNSSFM